MPKVVSQNFCQSHFPPLKKNSGSSSTIPTSKANFFASILVSKYKLDDQGVQPHHFPLQNSQCHPLSSPHANPSQARHLKKSKGPGGIPAIVLKTCAPELVPIINKLYQLSFPFGTFPTSWKLAHAKSPKKGDKSNRRNYRLIVITSLLSKTMETIIIKQLLAFLETNNPFSGHQYGFQKGF